MFKKLHDLHRYYRGKRVEIKERIAKICFDRRNIRENEFDIDKVSRVLFLRYDDKIGDMITTTMMFREIKKKYPNCKIDVVLKTKSSCIIDENPYINNIYEYQKNILRDYKLAITLKNCDYDLVFSFVEKMRGKEMFFIRNIYAKLYIGINRKGYKLFKYSVADYNGKHITERHKKMLEFLGINNINNKYELYLNKESEKKIELFFCRMKFEKIICINPYGASRYRKIRIEKLEDIVKKILEEVKNINITFIYPPNKKEELKSLVEKINNENILLFEEIKNIKDSISIINRSSLIISPDTSVVHIASALDKNQIAIYEQDYYKGKENENFLIWNPNSEKAKVLFSNKKENIEDRKYSDEIDLEELLAIVKEKINF